MSDKALRLFIFIFFAAVSAFAQDLTKSPYSAMGVGDLQFGGDATQDAIGQTSQGVRRAYDLNNQNPASYGSLKQTIIQAGFRYDLGTIANYSGSSPVDNFSTAYLMLGIPLYEKIHWGMSFGLVPFSSVGYNVSSNINYSNTPSTQVINGRGGLTKVYFGTGIALFRDFSVGVNISYIWGQIQSIKTIYFPPDSNMYNIEENKTTYPADIRLEYGAQYHKNFSTKKQKDKYKLVLGGTVSLAKPMYTTQDYSVRTLGVGGTVYSKDTILYQTSIPGTINFPLTYKMGFSFEETERWMICGDVNFSNWSTYRSFGATDSLKNMMGFSVGATYIPAKIDDVTPNYFRRVEYRIGARYDNGYLNINGNNISTIGVSAGLGLPIAKLRSRVNISAEYFYRGTTANNLIREDYFRLTLGIKFSDKWFVRNQYR